MYVVLGATGNTGSIIANSLLTKGERVRVVGRDASRLARFVRKGAEAFTANVTDAAALTKALSGARAAYLLLPPSLTSLDYRADQERESDSIAKAVRESDLRYAVLLSSFGAHVPEGTGPIAGLHSAEQKLNAINGLNVLRSEEHTSELQSRQYLVCRLLLEKKKKKILLPLFSQKIKQITQR